MILSLYLTYSKAHPMQWDVHTITFSGGCILFWLKALSRQNRRVLWHSPGIFLYMEMLGALKMQKLLGKGWGWAQPLHAHHELPKQVMQLLGVAEALAGLWQQTKSFIPLQTSLVFLLSSHAPPFPLAPLGNRINQVYIGGSGFFRHLTFPQHATGKQNHCESESIMKQQETFSLWNQQGIATDVNKSETSCWTSERHPLILWKREKQLV